MPRQDIPPLHGLRALASWTVVIYHFRELLQPDNWARVFFDQGALAVDLFFAMSGYIICMCYGSVFERGITARQLGRFLSIRVARIYPLHAVLLLAWLSVPGILVATGRPVPLSFDPLYYMASVLLVQGWGWTDQLAWNVPAWSISAELAFYLVFPFLAYAARLQRTKASLAAGLGLALAGIMAGGLLFGGLTEHVAQQAPVRCITECILGMWVFHAARRLLIPSTMLFVAASGLIGSYALGLAPDYAVLPVAFGCIVWGVLDPLHIVSRVLSLPVLCWLGEISFSTYMVHFLVRDWLKRLAVGRVPDIAVFDAYIVIVLFASVMLYRWVEVPGRRSGRRLTEQVFAQPGSPSVRGQKAA